MFTFLHAADLHLDSPLRGLSRHEDAPVEEIRGATRRALENLVELAIEKKVSFVVIAGDLYDGDQKDYATALFLNRQMVRLREAGIRVIAISGNHDAASVITKALSPPDNVTFLPVHEAGSVILPDVPAVVHGQGFAQASVQENLAAGYPGRISGSFNIGLLHTSLAGSTEHDTYAPCSMTDLEAKGYDYWALGHIHQPGVLRENPWVVYSGNIQGRKVNEIGERGCYLVMVDDALSVTGHEFVPLDVVRWDHVSLNLASCESLEEMRAGIAQVFSKAHREADGRLLALRLTLAGATPLHGELHSKLSRWQAECVSVAQEIDPGRIWFEQLKLKTTPVHDLIELAGRDDLTAMVLSALVDWEPAGGVPVVDSLQEKLPASVLSEIGEVPAADLKEDLAAIVLHSITTSPVDLP